VSGSTGSLRPLLILDCWHQEKNKEQCSKAWKAEQAAIEEAMMTSADPLRIWPGHWQGCEGNEGKEGCERNGDKVGCEVNGDEGTAD